MAISLNDIKKLSPMAKAMVVILSVFIIGYLDYFYLLSDAIEKKTKLDKQLEDMQGQIREKEKIAMQVHKYKADVAALRENYKIALQKLPDQREIPGLFHGRLVNDPGVQARNGMPCRCTSALHARAASGRLKNRPHRTAYKRFFRVE